MKRLNVLYLIRTWVLGGSHTIVFLLLKHLPRDRFNIICVPYDSHSGGDEVFAEAAAKRGLTVSDERIPWKSRSNWGRARGEIDRLIKKYDIDLIHTHDPHSNVLVGLGRKRWPCACVGSPYGWWRRVFPLRSHVYVYLEKRWALPNFERVITVSNDMKVRISKGGTPHDRIRVIRTGLDPAKLAAPEGAGAAVREEFGIPQDACVVGTVGRVYPEKGHGVLLAAVRDLAPRLPNLRVLVVGDGPRREPLQALAKELGIADRVTFTGFYDDLPGALNAMDIFALPSILDEGFPTVVLEAQMAGLPVIATDVGGTAETMHVGRTGLLVPRRNHKALAEAIHTLAAAPHQRMTMGRAGHEWVTTQFTLENMVGQVSATYEEAYNEYHGTS